MKFTDVYDALCVYHDPMSSEEERDASFVYLLENGPPGIRDALHTAFLRSFPGLHPDRIDADGTMWFTLDTFCRAFARSKFELDEVH